jgi:hypothetical protein
MMAMRIAATRTPSTPMSNAIARHTTGRPMRDRGLIRLSAIENEIEKRARASPVQSAEQRN